MQTNRAISLLKTIFLVTVALLVSFVFLFQRKVVHIGEKAHLGLRSQQPKYDAKEKIECVFSYKILHNVTAPDDVCRECLSQGYQDKVLERIFATINATNKKCVEFGFGYGEKSKELEMTDFLDNSSIVQGLNTHRLIQKGWQASFFDAEYENPSIRLFKHVLTEDNIGSAFHKANIPRDVDYVSIDVDSIDVWLLLGILKRGYRPRVISVEFNANWPANMPVTCAKEWAPWKPGSRIYGSSAAAINHVAQMYGYKVVDIMKKLDIFLVREDILEEKCINANKLPSFLWLGEGSLGHSVHTDCDKTEAAERLVDFPLAMSGHQDEASAKAMEYIWELNEVRATRGEKPFCVLDE